ncbi:hypothetical protein Syun_029890 [Stephania yunnanensis]|uniref:Uncharacterized protein n=1 Tax=Stephania yunnanensis TaxID=152371 RepID=A0AAP0HK97_9MAGN
MIREANLVVVLVSDQVALIPLSLMEFGMCIPTVNVILGYVLEVVIVDRPHHMKHKLRVGVELRHKRDGWHRNGWLTSV